MRERPDALAFGAMFLVPIGHTKAPETGQIIGTVKDQSGAVVPNVIVAALETEANPFRTGVNNSSGEFELRSLRSTMTLELGHVTQNVNVKDPLKLNRYEASFGGTVVFSKLYDSHNETFRPAATVTSLGIAKFDYPINDDGRLSARFFIHQFHLAENLRPGQSSDRVVEFCDPETRDGG